MTQSKDAQAQGVLESFATIGQIGGSLFASDIGKMIAAGGIEHVPTVILRWYAQYITLAGHVADASEDTEQKQRCFGLSESARIELEARFKTDDKAVH